MSEFIEILSPQALEQLNAANKLVDELAVKIKEINSFKSPLTPSGGDASVKQLTAQYDAQSRAIQSLQQQIQKLTEAKQKFNAKTSEEIVNNRKLSQSTDQIAKANSALCGAYEKLSLKIKQAAENLEKASTAEIKKAQREFDALDQKVQRANKAIGNFSNSVNNYKSALSGVGQLMSAFGISTGIYLGASIIKDIYETTKKLQSLDLALKMVSGSQSELASNQSFLQNISQKWGIEIKGLTEQYTKFYVASKKLLTTAEIQKVFEGVSKAGALMGLSIEKQQDAFVALEQMMSKGKVRSEELTKQLGNAMPGAMRAAAMAYMDLHPQITNVQVAEQKLMEEMKKGAVDSATYVPLIVKNFQKLYGIDTIDSVNTLASAQNRLSNSWTELIRHMNENDTNGLTSFFTTLMGYLDGALKGIDKLASSWGTLNKDTRSKARNEGRDIFIGELPTSTKEQIDENVKNYKELIVKAQREIFRINEEIKKGGTLQDVFTLNSKESERNQWVKDLGVAEGYLKAVSQHYQDIKKSKYVTTTKEEPSKPKLEKQINIQDKLLKKDYDYAIKMLEIAKKFQQEIFNDEEKTYAERLAAREIYSKISLDLIDTQNNREIQIEKDKAAQLLKNQEEARNKDLKSNAENVKNGYADKRIEIENRYAENVKTINYNLAQELYKIDLEYLEKTHELENQDLAFFEKIQKEKEKLTKETADIYFQMSQERRQKDANDERRTLTQRQASFEAWKNMAEAQLFFDEALAKANSNQSPEQIAKITAEFDKLRQSITDTISPLQKFANETKDWLSNFEKSFAGDAGFGKTFKFLQDDFFTNIDKAFEDGLISKEEKFAAYFNAITEMGKEAYSFLSQISQENFNDEYARLEQEKNIAIAFAGESAAGKAEVERQYEEKKKEIKRREARAKKQQAEFNIIVDTAQAIVSALAAYDYVSAILFGIMGAAQLAVVSSQPLPEYATGTDNHIGGLMKINDQKGSNYKEIVETPDGKKRIYDGRNVVVNAPKGTKVKTADETMDYLMFNKDLNNILTSNGINGQVNNMVVNSAMTDAQVDRIVNTIANNETVQVVSDGVDIIMKLKRKNEIVERTNKRIDFKGKSV